MATDVKISVALVTRNRPESLARCLASLRAQSVQPFEIVISDDSNQVEAAKINRQLALKWKCRYIEGPKRGLYANRNHVALACQGTHIRTVDDDHTFPQGHFERCIEAVKSEPHFIWTTGEISIFSGRVIGRAETANQLEPAGVGGPVHCLDDNWAIADGSTIYPAEIFRRGWFMVEEFGYGSSYLEFGAYLYRLGFHSRCLKGELVEHQHNTITNPNRNPEPDFASYLFASLCYNLFFKPNRLIAARYLASYFWHARFDRKIVLGWPRLIRLAKSRWEESDGNKF